MTLQDLYTLLSVTEYPVAYHSFQASNITPIPKPPYIVYLVDDTDNFGADNKVYHKTTNITVELYTANKNITAEQALEDVFDGAEIFYNKSETYIESEEMFQISYEITI